MKHLKTYKLFEDILSDFRIGDVEDILLELQHEGFTFQIKTPSMRQDMWQIIISKGDMSRRFVLSDIQDTLSRLHNYLKSVDKNLTASVISPVSGSQTLRYHDHYKEYRNGEIRKDTPLSMVILNFLKD